MHAAPRLTLVDTLKALASQLIVLHHLAFYGPMSDRAAVLAPALMSWLSEYARIAVQAFLVLGGFLAARSLAPLGTLAAGHPLALVGQRYLRLAPAYGAALLLAIGASALARQWMTHPSISAPPTLAQLLAHLLLLQDILGHEALSAGLWYVAIDLQLFALLVAALWLGRRHGPILVAALVIASLFHFNRDAAWDLWAPYFFAAYGLGAAAWWAAGHRRAGLWFALLAAAALAALVLDFRLRLAVAATVALLLGLAARHGLRAHGPASRLTGFLGRISYSVFLVHFPVCLLVNAAFVRFGAADPLANAGGMLLAWAASLAAGALFHRHVESRTFLPRLFGARTPRGAR
jgi:peptidoglycan/LPS O-acetylase OafA/YrhL